MVLKNKHPRDEYRKSEMSGLAKKKYKLIYISQYIYFNVFQNRRKITS